MFHLKMGLILFISINLNAVLVKEDEDISNILFNESKNFSNFQKGNDLIYGSLDFNLASDYLYELALKEDIALIDRIYLLKEAININNFKATTLKEIYTCYFALLLRQNQNKNMYKEIITLYGNLNEELQIDKDLICMRLEASGRLESFGDDFKKILFKAFSLYGNDFLFFKWFLKEDGFFFSIFNTIGIYFIDNENNVAILKDGVLVGIFSGIVDFGNKFSLTNRYFNKVYFKNKSPVYYENSLLGYKINYSVYPYVDMIEVQYPDKRDVYTFALHAFKYNIFNNLGYNFNSLGIRELFLINIKDFFLPTALNLFFEKISVLDIRSSLISKKKYFGFDLVEIKNYVLGSLVSIYRKVNGSKKFNYIEIYEKDKLKIKKALLDDDYFESYHSFE